jgi:SAM-dependent methyltransferase
MALAPIEGLVLSPLGRETLDDPRAPAAHVEATLDDIARINAWFGGRAAASFGLMQLLRDHPRPGPVTLLDVGAGSGDIARYLVRRAERWGIALELLALERHPLAARRCRRGGIPAVLADAGRLPLADRSVDIVLASQLLHHFDRASAVALLRELHRVARLGGIVADLRRHAVAAHGIWLACVVMGLHRVTRRDAVLSVRRGFSAGELETLLARAAVPARVYRRPGYRLVAVWRSRDAGG